MIETEDCEIGLCWECNFGLGGVIYAHDLSHTLWALPSEQDEQFQREPQRISGCFFIGYSVQVEDGGLTIEPAAEPPAPLNEEITDKRLQPNSKRFECCQVGRDRFVRMVMSESSVGGNRYKDSRSDMVRLIAFMTHPAGSSFVRTKRLAFIEQLARVQRRDCLPGPQPGISLAHLQSVGFRFTHPSQWCAGQRGGSLSTEERERVYLVWWRSTKENPLNWGSSYISNQQEASTSVFRQ